MVLEAIGIRNTVDIFSYLLGVELLLWMFDEVAVVQDPGNDLDLLAPHPPAGDLEVVGSVALGALGQQVGDVSLVIKDNVDITLGRRRRLVLAWPLYPVIGQ